MNDTAAHPERLPAAWTAHLETGVATIDLQHKVLFDLLLRTQEACDRGRWIDQDGVLPRLRSYADYHFRHEEDWIRQHTPGGAAEAVHARQHAGFLAQLDRWEQRRADGQLPLTAVLSFLQDWLLNHIVRQDLPLIRGLAQGNGAAAPPGAPMVSATSATPVAAAVQSTARVAPPSTSRDSPVTQALSSQAR